jgi:hypothetical protein
MRGIAEEREPFRHKGTGHRSADRKGTARADHLDLAKLKPEAALELGMKVSVGKREDARRLAIALSPDDR